MFLEHGVLKTNTARELRNEADFSGILGQSAIMQGVFSILKQVMSTDVRVLISGESGTGKECIARAIHDGGPRKNGPFVAVDCGALPANLLESELFSYVKGAFTARSEIARGCLKKRTAARCDCQHADGTAGQAAARHTRKRNPSAGQLAGEKSGCTHHRRGQ
jgi:DNA-binding NtrC family response regulator